jgi:hypothetical protein
VPHERVAVDRLQTQAGVAATVGRLMDFTTGHVEGEDLFT